MLSFFTDLRLAIVLNTSQVEFAYLDKVTSHRAIRVIDVSYVIVCHCCIECGGKADELCPYGVGGDANVDGR